MPPELKLRLRSITMIAAYYYNGEPFTSYYKIGKEADGPIRFAIVGTEGLLTKVISGQNGFKIEIIMLSRLGP